MLIINMEEKLPLYSGIVVVSILIFVITKTSVDGVYAKSRAIYNTRF